MIEADNGNDNSNDKPDLQRAWTHTNPQTGKKGARLHKRENVGNKYNFSCFIILYIIIHFMFCDIFVSLSC